MSFQQAQSGLIIPAVADACAMEVQQLNEIAGHIWTRYLAINLIKALEKFIWSQYNDWLINQQAVTNLKSNFEKIFASAN